MNPRIPLESALVFHQPLDEKVYIKPLVFFKLTSPSTCARGSPYGEVNQLLEESAQASEEGDLGRALEQAKEAGKKERQLSRTREQQGLQVGTTCQAQQPGSLNPIEKHHHHHPGFFFHKL